MDVFDVTKSVAKSTVPGQNAPAYITLQGTMGTALTDILMATAPATRINIEDDVDYTISKALSSDFLVATYGKNPIAIVLQGLMLDTTECIKSTSSIPEFYRTYNVHKNPEARVTVCVCVCGASTTYKCVLVGMKLDKDASTDTGSVVTSGYVLRLIGVETI